MNRISKLQLAALLLIGDAFAIFCLHGRICVMTAVGFSSGSLIQLFLALPLARAYDRGRTLADCGTIVRLVLLTYVLVWGGALFAMLREASEVIYIPYERTGIFGQLAVAGLVALVCVYVSSSGIKALARSAVIAAGLGAVCVGIVVVSAGFQSDAGNLLRPTESSLWQELMRGFAASGNLGSFVVLLGFTADDRTDTAALYFTCKAVLSGVVLFTAVLVTGGIMDVLSFPVISAAQLSQPFPVQRTDSLFLVVFSVFAVYTAAVQASAAEYLIARTFPQLKRFRCTLALMIMAAAGAVMSAPSQYTELYAAAALTALLIVPAEGLLKGGVRKRERT